MKRQLIFGCWAGVALAALVSAGCRPSSTTSGTDSATGEPVEVNEELTGRVEVDGSSTVELISSAIAEAMAVSYPNVNVTVGTSGTGGGFERFVRGETEVQNASRPIQRGEFEAAKSNGVTFIEVPIAYDGLTLVVPRSNDWVDQLTLEEVRAIFTEEGGKKTWAEVREGWPNEQIRIFAPGTDSGTFDYFKEVVAGKEGNIRSDIDTSEDDNVLVRGVAGSRNSIGFFGVAYYENNKDQLKAVPIVNPETGEAVLPTSETIEKGTYAPFSRPLFIYLKADAMKRPEMKVFSNFYLDHAAEKAAEVGYVRLPDELYERARKHVQQRLTGTHYLDEEMESREGPLPEVYTEENLTSF